MSARRDAVKAYIVLIAGDGTLTGSSSPGTIASKVIAAFTADVLAAGGELANMAAESAIGNIGVKVETVARNMAERGLRSIWQELQSQIRKK
jgi:hypothetical protein